MHVLVVIDRFSDIRLVTDYLTRRFESGAIEVSLLALTDALPANLDEPEAVQLLQDAADLAGCLWQVGEVRTCLAKGHWTSEISRVSRACGAEVVLLEASGASRLSGALRLNRLARRLFRESRCAVELIRGESSAPAAPLDVVVPIQAERVKAFPVESLRRLSWRQGTRIRLVGLLPPLIERSQLEANDGALLLARNRLSMRQAQMESDLQRLGARLAQEFAGQCLIEHATASSSLTEVARLAAAAGQLLLVADEARGDSRLARSAARWLPAWQALSAGSSMLLISPLCPGRRPATAWQPGTV